MIKKLLSFGVFALLTAGVASADEGQYLHIRTSGGWQVLNLEQVDRLTFTGGQMVAADANNNTLGSFEQSSLNEMYFDETAGVESTLAKAEGAAFSFANGVVTMKEDGRIEIFALDGVLLTAINAKKGETIDLKAISSKYVILKSGKVAQKVSLR